MWRALWLLLTVVPAPLSASQSTQQAESPPTMPSAMARLQANDTTGAIRILTAVTEREPTNGRAWRRLGVLYQAVKDLDRAAGAYARALEVEPANPAPLYNLGVVYALKRDTSQAFAWFEKAKASRKIDLTQLTADSNLAYLKGQPRFASLLPTARDFENPFVEPVTILREWRGEAPGDQFGWIARGIGDVDGDSIADLVTSAPSNAAGGANAGRIYLYSSGTGKQLWSADGRAKDELGTGLEAAGDVNRDGIPDVVAGAPGAGYVRVYSGRDGKVLRELKAEAPSDRFGQLAAGVGDIDGDGFADLIIGAPASNANGQGSGRAYVYSGKNGHRLLTLTGERAGDGFGSAVAGHTDRSHKLLVVGAAQAGPAKTGRAYAYDGLSQRAKFVVDADETGAAFAGMFVTVAGDVDGDSTPDVYVSDWPNNAKGPSTGRVYLYSGKDGRQLHAFTGEMVGEGFGSSSSAAGDVNGDGHADLIVGAWQYYREAVGAGRAYLLSGKDGNLLRTYTCRTPGDTFGFDAVSIGDINRDGMTDLLITSGWSGVSGFHSGRVFIISSGVRRGQ